MEAPKGRGRITPLPPPEPDGVSRPVERAPRQWMPVGVALAGLVAFALWLAGTGAPVSNEAAGGNSQSTLAPLSAEDTAPSVSTTIGPTTTTVAPTLGEMLPWLDGSLLIFSSSIEGTFLSVWDDGLAAPQEFRLSGSNVTRVEPEPASLSFVAYETSGTVNSLYLGGWRIQEPIFVGSQGFAWDPAGSATLAWVGTDQVTGETALYRQRIAERLVKVATLPDRSRLVGWTDAGLVLEVVQGPSVNVIDPVTGVPQRKAPTLTELRDTAGELLASVAAAPLRTAPDGTVIASGNVDAFEIAEIELDEGVFEVGSQHVVLDAANGTFVVRSVPVVEILTDGQQIFAPDGRWSLSRDGQWAGRTTDAGLGTAIQMRSMATQAVRVVAIRGNAQHNTVGFSQDGEWFFAHSTSVDELVAASDSGAQFIVPFERAIRLGGVFVRP